MSLSPSWGAFLSSKVSMRWSHSSHDPRGGRSPILQVEKLSLSKCKGRVQDLGPESGGAGSDGHRGGGGILSRC